MFEGPARCLLGLSYFNELGITGGISSPLLTSQIPWSKQGGGTLAQSLLSESDGTERWELCMPWSFQVYGLGELCQRWPHAKHGWDTARASGRRRQNRCPWCENCHRERTFPSGGWTSFKLLQRKHQSFLEPQVNSSRHVSTMVCGRNLKPKENSTMNFSRACIHHFPQVQDKRVSRKHATLEIKDDKLVLVPVSLPNARGWCAIFVFMQWKQSLKVLFRFFCRFTQIRAFIR